MIHNYTSNISREQFELIREDLENARKTTRPRTVDLYEVFCGVLYLLTTGCQWHNPPSDLPNWKTVYSYYQIWRKVDPQSVKNTWTAEEKGYDAGKKVSGIKRHIAVDTNGLIHTIEITTANITDRKGAIQMCQRHTESLKKVKNHAL